MAMLISEKEMELLIFKENKLDTARKDVIEYKNVLLRLKLLTGMVDLLKRYWGEGDIEMSLKDMLGEDCFLAASAQTKKN